MTEGHGPTWRNGEGRSDAGPLGRSDAERGVGHAGVLPSPTRHRGAGRGVWAGAGVAREVSGWTPTGGGPGTAELPVGWGLPPGRESETTFPAGLWSLCHY